MNGTWFRSTRRRNSPSSFATSFGPEPGSVLGLFATSFGPEPGSVLGLHAQQAPAGPEDVLLEVWETTRTRHFDPDLGGVDWDAALVRARARLVTDGLSVAANAMLGEIGTSHTHLYTRDDEGWAFLVELFWDGLVDDEPFAPVAPFRSRIGRATRLTLQTAPDAEPREIHLVPEARSAREVLARALRRSARIVETGARRVGVVHVWSWAGEAMQDVLLTTLESLRDDGAEALVLDLRAGWGGANLSYLEAFRTDLPALAGRPRSDEPTELGPHWTKPVVLLVDEGTTSGKELFAHAFRQIGRGSIVGANTAGAVVGGSGFLMADGSLLYLAVMDIEVGGERLEGVGFAPDLAVPFERFWAAGRDPQLDAAPVEARRQLQ